MVSKLVLHILVDLDSDIQLKTNRVTFETDDAVVYSIFFYKRVWLSLVLEILCDVCIVITCFPVIDVMNFEIILTSYQAVFLHDFLDNNLNILRTKGAFKMKYKALFINFK